MALTPSQEARVRVLIADEFNRRGARSAAVDWIIDLVMANATTRRAALLALVQAARSGEQDARAAVDPNAATAKADLDSDITVLQGIETDI